MASRRSEGWTEVAERVYSKRFPIFDVTVGVVVGDDAVLVIDTRGSTLEGRRLRDEIRRITRTPVRAVVNTHFHFDHCFGNAAFDGVPIWGHRACARHLAMSGDADRAEVMRYIPRRAEELELTRVSPPTEFVVTRQTLDLGGRVVELWHLGRGHTDGDVVVTVPDVSVAFAGDLLEESGPPAFADSWPLEWPEALDALLEMGIPTIVPGHGHVVDRPFTERARDDLRVLARLLEQAMTGVVRLSDVVHASPFPPEHTKVAFNRQRAIGRAGGRRVTGER